MKDRKERKKGRKERKKERKKDVKIVPDLLFRL